MPRKQKKHEMTILALFGPADPMRQLLRDDAFGRGYTLLCYDQVFDALSRMPIMDIENPVIIAARPRQLNLDAAAAFEALLTPGTAHYALWRDGGGDFDFSRWPLPPANLHLVDTIRTWGTLLDRLQSSSPAQRLPDDGPSAFSRRTDILRLAPLCQAELDALLGANL